MFFKFSKLSATPAPPNDPPLGVYIGSQADIGVGEKLPEKHLTPVNPTNLQKPSSVQPVILNCQPQKLAVTCTGNQPMLRQFNR